MFVVPLNHLKTLASEAALSAVSGGHLVPRGRGEWRRKERGERKRERDRGAREREKGRRRLEGKIG